MQTRGVRGNRSIFAIQSGAFISQSGRMTSASSYVQSNRRLVEFAGTNSDDFFNVCDEDLAVANLSGSS